MTNPQLFIDGMIFLYWQHKENMVKSVAECWLAAGVHEQYGHLYSLIDKKLYEID